MAICSLTLPFRSAVRGLAATAFLFLGGAALQPAFAGDESWWEGFAPWGVDGRVYTLAVHGGDLFVAGEFVEAGGETCHNVARWDGVRWRPVGAGTDGLVNVLLPLETALMMGGHFTEVDGVPALRTAKYQGGFWYQLGDGFNDAVQDMVMQDATLVACGHFDESGSVATGRVAAFDGLAWSAYPAVSPILYGVAYDLHRAYAQLWAGGWWMYDDQWHDLNCLAVNDGAAWSLPGGTSGPDGTVQCMCDRDGTLYLGGDFTHVNGEPSDHFAFWTPGEGFHPVTGLTGAAYAIHDHDGLLAVGGDAGVAPYDPILGWRDNLGLQMVRDLTSYGLDLMAGGFFNYTGADEEGVACLDGNDWVRLGGGLQAPGANPDLYRVNALCRWDGELVAGGSFTVFRLTSGAANCSNVGRWNGKYWHPLGRGLAGEVRALANYDGILVAAGDFESAGAEPAAHVAYWDGVTWRQLGGGIPGFGVSANTLAVHDGKLYLGGWFRQSGGAPGDYLAVWDGTAWASFPSPIAGEVKALAVHDGDLVAAGLLSTAGGYPVNKIARWDGSAWHALGAGVDGMVTALGLDPDGPALVASGYFANAGGAPANRIARWDGAGWSALGAGLDNVAQSILGTTVGLFVGGSFTTAGGAPAAAVAHWDAGTWQPLGSGMSGGGGAAPCVNALLVHGHELYLGGDFATAGGKPSMDLARWTEDVVGVQDGAEPPRVRPGELRAWPNPFNPNTTVEFSLPAACVADLAVYDTRGRRLRTLTHATWSAGPHRVDWDGRDDAGHAAPAGVYVIRLDAPRASAVVKIMLVQ